MWGSDWRLWYVHVAPQRNPFHGDAEVWSPQGSERFPHVVVQGHSKSPPDHPALAGGELAPLDPQPRFTSRQTSASPARWLEAEHHYAYRKIS